MSDSPTEPTKPLMTVIAGRPAKVLPYLTNIRGVFVQCRLIDGTDAWIPMSELCRLFCEEMHRQVQAKEETGE